MKTVQPPCSHPDILKLQIPDILSLDPDASLHRISATARQHRTEAEADPQDPDWWLAMAIMAHGVGMFAHAIDCATRATMLGLASGSERCVMHARLVNSSVEVLKGNYEDARPLIDQMAQASQLSPGGVLEALYKEAEANFLVRTGSFATGEFVAATTAIQRAGDIYRDEGDVDGEIRSLCILGRATAGRGDYTSALEQFDAGMTKCRDADNWQNCHMLLFLTAQALADQGYRNGVDELYLLSRQWSDFVGDRVTHAATLAGQGRLYYFEMSNGASDEFQWRSAPLVSGASMLTEIGALPMAMSCHATLANMCEKALDPEGADRHRRIIEAMSTTAQAKSPAHVRIQHRMELEADTYNRNRRMADRLYKGIETSPDALLIFDIRWKLDGSAGDFINEFRNPAANELLNLKPTAVRMLAELRSNPLFDGIEAAINVAVENGKDSQHELRVDLPDGGSQWLIRRVTPSANGAVVTFRDVSESRNLRILSGRIQLATSAGGVGVFEFDCDVGRFIWDIRMHELYGMEPGAFGGTLEDWTAQVHPEDRDRVRNEWKSAGGASDGFESDFRLLLSSGEVRFIHALARVTRNADGSPARIVGTNLDVTGHKRLAEELFDEKERLRVTLSSIADAVISTDTESRITFMNPVAEQMTGWTLAEASGRSLSVVFQLVDEKTGNAIAASTEQCITTMRPVYPGEGGVLLSRSGERRDVQQSSAPVRTSSGESIGAVVVFQDITRSRTLQRELLRTAMHDSLTGLPNRASFAAALTAACDQSSTAGREHVLCFMDLDRFKTVNDSAGHAAGDALLKEVGALIRQSVRRNDFVARLGGDEFALLLSDCALSTAESIAGSLVSAINSLRFPWKDRSYSIGASIGLTAITRNSSNSGDLMVHADMACYAAKAAGRNRISLYNHQNVETPVQV